MQCFVFSTIYLPTSYVAKIEIYRFVKVVF